MIYSMTAFSRQEGDTENGHLVWELRSVNHRFSEVSLRLPEELRFLEPKMPLCVFKPQINRQTSRRRWKLIRRWWKSWPM